MSEVFVSLLPFIIGSALVPVQIIIVVLLLGNATQGPLKAIAFVVGMCLVRLAQGVLFGRILVNDYGDSASEGSGWIKSTLLLVLGLVLLINAVRYYFKEPDPDAPPPKWLTMLDGITVLKALAMGAGLVVIGAKLWVFTLGAISVIGEAALGQRESTIAYLLYVVLAATLLVIPILIRLLFPARAESLLGSLNDWLEVHNRAIMIVVSLVFGALFAYQGITGLLR